MTRGALAHLSWSRSTCIPGVAMQVLPNSQIAVTMQVYSEVLSEATKDALRRLGDSLDG
jgi:hypothetical protein